MKNGYLAFLINDPVNDANPPNKNPIKVVMAINFENNTNEYKKNIIIPLMCDVRENHTYINRTQTIFDCFKKQMTIE